MQRHDGYQFAKKFFSTENASSYDDIVRFTTFGQDYFWKSQIVNIVNKQYCSLLDLACGTGILSSMLKKKEEKEGCEGKRSVFGLDLTFAYLQIAKKKKGLNFTLTNGTAELLPYKNESFDYVISSYLAKYVNIERVVEECWRILIHGGTTVFHDFTYPATKSIMVSFWNAYFIILRLSTHIIKAWAPVFQQLDSIIRRSNWVEDTMKALKIKGFEDISCKYYTMSTASIISAKKP